MSDIIKYNRATVIISKLREYDHSLSIELFTHYVGFLGLTGDDITEFASECGFLICGDVL